MWVWVICKKAGLHQAACPQIPHSDSSWIHSSLIVIITMIIVMAATVYWTLSHLISLNHQRLRNIILPPFPGALYIYIYTHIYVCVHIYQALLNMVLWFIYDNGYHLSILLIFWDLERSVCGIFQARILECVAFPFSRESSQPRTQVSCIAGRFLTVWATREALKQLCKVT